MNQLEMTPSITVNLGNLTSSTVVANINQSQRAMHKLLSTCLAHDGLNVAQWTLLGSLVDGPLTPTALANLLNIKTAYIAMLLKELRQMGDLVIETASIEDSRSKILELSKEGRQFVDQVESKLQVCLQRELAQKIAPADLETFFQVSAYIAKNVEHESM